MRPATGLVLLLAGLLGCEPAPQPPVAALQPPQVLTSVGPPGLASATDSAGESPAGAPLLDSPSALAEYLYGARQITEVIIPAIQVGADVQPVGWRSDLTPQADGEVEWDSPEAAVGWVVSSALPDMAGHTILYGHNNLYTQVFRDLADLAAGDFIYLRAADGLWQYEVEAVNTLLVLGAGAANARAYEEYLQVAEAGRLTLVSCWPAISNTHRVVVVAHLVNTPP